MKIKDMNGWLIPPSGCELLQVVAEGAYLRVDYQRRLERTETPLVIEEKQRLIQIYLNDQGREVLRTITEYSNHCYKPAPISAPVAWWQTPWWQRIKRFWNSPQPDSD